MAKKIFIFALFLGLAVIGKSQSVSAETTVAEYFSESIVGDDLYTYAYPEATAFITLEKGSAHSGEYCLKIELDAITYSGAAIGRGRLVDISRLKNGYVEFWVKGAQGGENFEVQLIDADDTDGTKTEVGAMATPNYVTVKKEWQKVQIPLSAFPPNGQYWDGSKINPNKFEPKELKEVKFDVRPGDNIGKTKIIIYVDDVKIVRTD